MEFGVSSLKEKLNQFQIFKFINFIFEMIIYTHQDCHKKFNGFNHPERK